MPKILKLVEYSHQILRRKTKSVTFPLSNQDRELIADMKHSIQDEQLKAADAPWVVQWGWPLISGALIKAFFFLALAAILLKRSK